MPTILTLHQCFLFAQFSGGECKEEDSVENVAAEYRNEILDEFREKTRNFDEALVETYTEMLRDLIQKSVERFTETNRHRRVRLYIFMLLYSKARLLKYMKTFRNTKRSLFYPESRRLRRE